MNIALLSHRFGNIGHSFMAIGVEEAIRAAFGRSATIQHWEQHRTFNVYSRRHPLSWLDRVHNLRMPSLLRVINRPVVSRALWKSAKDVRQIDLALACGGPSLAVGAADNPEHVALLNHLYGAIAHQGVRIVDVGLGSCVPISRLSDDVASMYGHADLEVFRRLMAATATSLVRDTTARKTMRFIGRECELIPCAAFLSARSFRPKVCTNSIRKIVAINYQREGANSSWGQPIDGPRWAATIRELSRRLSNRHQVVFLCQNQREYTEVSAVLDGATAVCPENAIDYLRIIREFDAAVVSRIHAAIPLASYGIPSITVGTDSRIQALEPIGLKTHYINDATVDILEEQVETALCQSAEYQERLLVLREQTLDTYVARFRSILAAK